MTSGKSVGAEGTSIFSRRCGGMFTAVFLLGAVLLAGVADARPRLGSGGSEQPSASVNAQHPGSTRISGSVAAEAIEISPDAAPPSAEESESLAGEESESESESPAAEESESPAGNPLAAGVVKAVRQEIENNLRARGVTGRWISFERYTAYTLAKHAARHTGNELTGNCRLNWYQSLLKDPLDAPRQAEAFTRQVFEDLKAPSQGVARTAALAAVKLDLPARSQIRAASADSPAEALEIVRKALILTQQEYAAALAPLSKSQISGLKQKVYPVMVANNQFGHTLNERSTGRWLCDTMEQIDRDAMMRAGEAIIPLADAGLLAQLKEIDSRELRYGKFPITIAGVTGPVADVIATEAGDIVIGDHGANQYRLDEIPNLVAVIDLGGDDTYYDGVVTEDRPVLLIIDLAGDDQYRASRPCVQGSSILGISMLVDDAGDDYYYAQDMAQGSTIAGVGVLIDNAGNDRYLGRKRIQGQAMFGLGLLVDRGGNDKYHGALWTQGFAGPYGMAALCDVDGRDTYYTGGMYLDNYDETPGYEGWGQGVGAGIRQVANGGIGLILDGGGDDSYEYDYLAHGGGYWCGLGFARDFGGNDVRHAYTRTSYNGGRRPEAAFQRFGAGWGCHYSLGFLFDDDGDDYYGGTIMGVGFAWDCSSGFLFDFAGDDHYAARGGNTQGRGNEMGFGVLADFRGNDKYDSGGIGYASTGITYHPEGASGGNFSFAIDYGGQDTYACRAPNNSINRRGSPSGFVIDRPTRAEVAEQKRKEAELAEKQKKEAELAKKQPKETDARQKLTVANQEKPAAQTKR